MTSDPVLIEAVKFFNADELVSALNGLIRSAMEIKRSNGDKYPDPSEVDIEIWDEVALLEETLTDGSKVYNIELR